MHGYRHFAASKSFGFHAEIRTPSETESEEGYVPLAVTRIHAGRPITAFEDFVISAMGPLSNLLLLIVNLSNFLFFWNFGFGVTAVVNFLVLVGMRRS